MKKLFIALIFVLFIIPVVYADKYFEYVPATEKNIISMAKFMEKDASLMIIISGYSKEIKPDEVDALVDSVKAVEELCMLAGIYDKILVIKFANEDPKRYNKLKDGVYIKLIHVRHKHK